MIQVGKKKGNQPLDDAIMDHLRHTRISPEEAYDKAIDKKKFRAIPERAAARHVGRISHMRIPDLDKILVRDAARPTTAFPISISPSAIRFRWKISAS